MTDATCDEGSASSDGEKEDPAVMAAELEQLFELNWKADQRAIKAWQKAHPGNDLTWPDRCDMVTWLIGELGGLRTEASKAAARIEAQDVVMAKVVADLARRYAAGERLEVARFCDEELDRTGRLLGEVRQAAAGLSRAT